MQKTKITAIIACAGSATRAKQNQNKIFSLVSGIPVVLRTVSAFDNVKTVDEILIVHSAGEDGKIKEILRDIKKPVSYVLGGKTRFESIKNALNTLSGGAVLIHDGARPYIEQVDIENCIKTVLNFGSAVLSSTPTNSILETDGNDEILSSGRKDKLYALTPQCFLTDNIKIAYAHASEEDGYTDDAGVYTAYFGKCKAVKTQNANKKLTYPEDFENGEIISSCGTGFDLHKLVEGRKLILGGIEIPHDKGLLGHSDADVLTHAIMDALLSSASLRDIGYHFSDKDKKFKDISSILLLEEVMKMLTIKGLKPVHVSAVVMAEKPKLSPYREEITKKLASVMGLDESAVGITFTTLEGIGTVGREEGIASQAYVLTKNI